MQKYLIDFEGAIENALIKSFKMSPHTLVWRSPFYGQPLEWVWSRLANGHKRVWERLLQTIKWGLILKL